MRDLVLVIGFVVPMIMRKMIMTYGHVLKDGGKYFMFISSRLGWIEDLSGCFGTIKNVFDFSWRLSNQIFVLADAIIEKCITK